MPPNEVQQVHPNQACTITANTVAGVSQACRVLAVAQNPALVNGSYLFYVTVVPDASTGQLFAGMPVDVSIQVDHATNVLAVPQTAVYLLGGLPHADVWSGKRAVPTAITTGMQGTALVQITSGLTNGEQVVLSANQGLPQSATTVAVSQ